MPVSVVSNAPGVTGNVNSAHKSWHTLYTRGPDMRFLVGNAHLHVGPATCPSTSKELNMLVYHFVKFWNTMIWNQYFLESWSNVHRGLPKNVTICFILAFYIVM